MDNPEGEDQIDAIVGAALKAMVESGVNRARLGAFAANFRVEVAEILGRSPAKPAEPDLLTIVKQAVREVVADPANAVAPRRARAKTAQRVYVTVNGKATSMTLSVESLASLDEISGARKKSKAIIQQLAESAPANVSNRSRWVQERLVAWAAANANPKDEQARH